MNHYKISVLVSSVLFAGIFTSVAFAEPESARKTIDIDVNVKESISMMVTPEQAYNDGKNNVVLDMDAAMYQEVQAHVKAATNSLAGLRVLVNDVDEDTNLNHEESDSIIPTSTNIAVGTAAWGIKATLPGATEESYSEIPKRSENGLVLIYTDRPTPSGEYDETDIAFAFSTSYSQPVGVYKDVVVFTATTNASSPALDGNYSLMFNTGNETKIPTTTRTIGELVDLSAVTAQLDSEFFVVESYVDQRGNEYPNSGVVDVNQSGLSAVILTVKWQKLKFFGGISTMQEMKPKFCAQETTPYASATAVDTTGEHYGDRNYIPQTTITDTRDGEAYTIRKLADGACWMVQNLRLKLTADRSLTSVDTDVASFTPTLSTQTTDMIPWGTYEKPSDVNKSRSYNSGNKNQGTLYNWFTATGGTGVASNKTQNATGSLCPKGWHLPNGQSTTTGSTAKLVNAYYPGVDVNDAAETGDSPSFLQAFNFQPSGYLYYLNGGIEEPNDVTYLWTKTPNLSGLYEEFNNATALFMDHVIVVPRNLIGKVYGAAMRCVAY